MKAAAIQSSFVAKVPGLLARWVRAAVRGFGGLSNKLALPTRFQPQGWLAKVLVALLFCALVAGSLGIINGAAQEILRSQAETLARRWADYLTANVPELKLVAKGQPPTSQSVAMFERAHGTGNIFRIEVLDLEGKPRFISQSTNSAVQLPEENPQERLSDLQQTRQGMLQLKTRRANGRGQPDYYTHALVPIFAGGSVVGMLSFFIDMSQPYQNVMQVLTAATLSFGLVLAVAFGLPALGFWLRTRQKEVAETQLRFLAQHDALTELENRNVLVGKLELALATQDARNQKLAVLCMNLDHFKDVNDSLGHEAGDKLLKQVAGRLRQVLACNEHVARASGDEFIVLQEAIPSRESAALLAQRLLGEFSRPFVIDGHVLRIGPSIGIAIWPEDGTEAETLTKNADTALQAVKSAERGTYYFFEAAMDALQQRRRHVAERVRFACERNAFMLNYQPVFSLSTGLLSGFEALVRLKGADGDMISPAEFVPVAEELGLVTKIGAFVLETACQQACSWPHDLTVAVNISPDEFRAGNVVERVAKALAKSGLEPERLEVEVTEGVLLADTDTTQRTIDGLKKLGVAIVLDDFGTGYSSLSYLWQFRFDKIKIDQSFVKAIGKNGNVSDIIRTIVALGRALDLRVTAEGVETEAQAAVLRAMRCDLVQGYLYGAPVAQPDIPAFVNRPLPRSLAERARREAEPKLVKS